MTDSRKGLFVKEPHTDALADSQRPLALVEVDDTLQRADILLQSRRVGEDRAALREPLRDADHTAPPGGAVADGIVFNLRPLADGHPADDFLVHFDPDDAR